MATTSSAAVGTDRRHNADRLLALSPLFIPLFLCIRLLGNPVPILQRWFQRWLVSIGIQSIDGIRQEMHTVLDGKRDAVSSQLLAYLIMAFAGYMATTRLVPHIQQYTLRKGIAGKDLGKRGTATADQPMYDCLCLVILHTLFSCLLWLHFLPQHLHFVSRFSLVSSL